MSTGVVIFAHGSSIESANDAVRAVTARVASLGKFARIETAFLESGRPSLSEAVDRLINSGASRIVIAPYFLTLGLHLQRDLPRMVEGIRIQHPGVEVAVTPPLDGHEALHGVLVDRLREALAQK